MSSFNGRIIDQNFLSCNSLKMKEFSIFNLRFLIFNILLAISLLTGCKARSDTPPPPAHLLGHLPASAKEQTLVLYPEVTGNLMPDLTGVCYVPFGHTDLVREIDPGLMLFDQIFDLVIPVTRDAKGRIQQDLSALDGYLEGVTGSGARPLISLDFTPTVLSSLPHLENSIRRSVPPVSYEDWEQLVYEVVRYVVREKQVDAAYWSVWNEPDLGMFWNVEHSPYTNRAAIARGSDLWTPFRMRTGAAGQFNELGRMVEYMRLYEATVRGVRRADPTARVGGPNTSSFRERWIAVFLNQCAERGLPVDFVAWHYPGYPEEMRANMAWLQETSAKAGIETPAVVITEWNADHGNGWDSWTETLESLDIIEGMASSGVEAAFYYTVGRLILTDTHTISPLGTAFQNLSMLQGRQIKCETTAGSGALATQDADGVIRAFLWSQAADPERISILPGIGADLGSFTSYSLNIYRENAPLMTYTGVLEQDGVVSATLPGGGRRMVTVVFHTGRQMP